MLTHRQIENVLYAHYNLGESVDSIIKRYTMGPKKVMPDGSIHQSVKGNSFSLTKQITFAINKKRIFRVIESTRPVDCFNHKDESYYDNEMLYGNTDMLESLKDGSTYKMSDLTYEDVSDELPKNMEPSSFKEFIDYAVINVEYIN
jgi:hypothetical protein